VARRSTICLHSAKMMGSLYPSYQNCASGERKQIEAIACDVLVIGSGAAGLTTAITAHHFGADVLVVEKTSTFGATIGRMAVGAGKSTRAAFGRRRLASG